MDVIIPADYTQYLKDIIQEQSNRIAEFKYLLNEKQESCKQKLLDKMQTDFFNVRSKKLKLLSKHSHKFRANVIKPKRDKLILLKHRKATRKYKLTKKYHYINPTFWILNPSDNIYRIERDINKLRQKHGFENYNKYIKMYYYNNIKSFDDIKNYLTSIYMEEHNAFKLQISFGYACENIYNEIRIFEPSQQYYFDMPKLIKNQQDINDLFNYLSGDEIINKISLEFSESSTRLVGVYAMAIKIFRLSYPVGAKTQLPDYIKKSMFIIGLDQVEDNFCAWACFAIIDGSRKDRYIKQAKQLFSTFYNLDEKETDYSIKTYPGFDYINELDKYEATTEYAINIICYNQDKSITYIRKSKYNATKDRVYLNLYKKHLSVVTDLTKLAKCYVCKTCGYGFEDNANLDRHSKICQTVTIDKFSSKSDIWNCKRNIIVELSEYFEVSVDFKYDYLITYDLESIQLKIKEKGGDKLKFVTQHVPISASIASNVPGYDKEKFILSKEPASITSDLFEYFDNISKTAAELMQIKLQPLIDKVKLHKNEDRKEKYLNEIYKYYSSIPILGFNSGFYDMGLLINEGFIEQILKRDNDPFVLKTGNRYKCIKTNQFLFLDQMSYCAAGTSLDAFVKAYDVGEIKGIFPYEWFDSYEKLDYPISVLKVDDFDSSLKNTKLSELEFTKFINTCKDNGLVYIKDLLQWYNNLDVRPMLKACLKQKEFYYTFNLDMYKDATSLPALSENIMFQYSIKGFDEFLKLKRKPDRKSEIYNKNISQKIEEYKLQDIKAKRSVDNNYIEILDVRNLLIKEKYSCHYCWNAVSYTYPYVWTLDRIDCSKSHTKDNCVIACLTCNKSRSDQLYKMFYREKALERYDKNYPLIRIINKENHEVFYKLKKNIVGGASIVYHRYHEKDVTQITRVHYDQINKKWTHDQEGKTVKKICGFDANALYLHCLGQDMPCGELKWISTEHIAYYNNKDIQYFYNKFYGFLEVDIEVPEDKYEYFSEMCPIFKNTEYDESICGEYTKNLVLQTKKKFTKSRKLIGTLQATKILIISDRLKWLINHGCKVTKLYGIIPAIPRKIFKGFMEWVSDERRKGDVDTKYAIIADGAKTVGNSAFGRTIMNKNKHKTTKFCDKTKFKKWACKSNFYDASHRDGLYEVTLNKRNIHQNMPLQIGCVVFDYSKLRMLQFYYDCIDKYLNRSDFQYIEMDTDSAYMALTADFETLIKPELREEFEKDKVNWFPRTDTTEHKMYDKRKPGLFKIEFEGDGMVALCSKSYYVWGNKNKCSAKGVQQKRNIEILNKYTYLRCLQSKEQINANNKGFRFTNNSIKTYEQNKVGLSSIYTKGVLFEDGIHIRPLLI